MLFHMSCVKALESLAAWTEPPTADADVEQYLINDWSGGKLLKKGFLYIGKTKNMPPYTPFWAIIVIFQELHLSSTVWKKLLLAVK